MESYEGKVLEVGGVLGWLESETIGRYVPLHSIQYTLFTTQYYSTIMTGFYTCYFSFVEMLDSIEYSSV